MSTPTTETLTTQSLTDLLAHLPLGSVCTIAVANGFELVPVSDIEISVGPACSTLVITPASTIRVDVQTDSTLRDACEALWPFIRHFPLSGACPEASAAVMSIGEVLGKHVDRAKLDATYRYNDGVADGITAAAKAVIDLNLSSACGPTMAKKIYDAVVSAGG